MNKLKIQFSKIDYLLEIIGLLAIASLVLLPAYYYNELPEQIPQHFNLSGQVNSYANKNTILLLPVLGLVLYIALSILNKYPEVFNYPVNIKNNNIEKIQLLAVRTINFIKVIIILMFSYLNFKTIKISLKIATKIDVFVFIVFIILIFTAIAIMITKMIKANR